MAFDGKLKFDTAVDLSGFQAGVEGISGLAGKGLSGVKSLAEIGMSAIKSSVSITADAMKEVGEIAADLSKKAIEVGKSFESSMSNVIATMGATKDSMVEITNADGTTSMANAYDMLSDKAKEMGATTQFSASEAADALNYLALAGYDTQKACDALPSVLDLAAAGGMELASASDLVTDAMSALNMKATTENLGKFNDSLAKTASSANTSVSQLGEAVLVCGGQAKLAGMDTTQMNTALGILANNGIKGSEGGTALRNVLKNLYTPTQNAANAMAELGIQTSDANGNLRSVQNVLTDTMSAMEGLSDADKMTYMSEIFDTRTISAANALLNNSGENWDELSGKIADCDGACVKMAKTMNDNLEGDIKILNSSLEGLGVNFYENIVGYLRQTVQEASSWITQLDKAFQTDGFDGLAIAVSGVLADMMSKVYKELPAMLDLGSDFIKTICDGIKNKISLIRTQGSTIITGLLESFVSNFNSFYDIGFSVLSYLLSGLNQNKGELADTVRDFVIGISRTLINNLPQMVKNGSEIILSIIQGVSAVIPSLLETGAEALMNIIAGISDTIPKLIPVAVKIINSLVSTIAKNLPLILSAGLDIILSLINVVIENLPMLIETGMQLLTNIITGIAEALPVLVEMIPSIIKTIIDLFMSNFGMIMELGVSLLVTLCDSIAENLPSLITVIINLILYIVQVVTENIDTIFNAGVSILFAIIEGIIQSIPILVEDAPKIINALCDSLNAHLFELLAVGLALIVNLAQGLWDNRQVILDNLGQIALMIFNIISTIDLLNAGKSILTALKDGIVSMKSVVQSGMDDVWTSIKNIFTDAPTKFREIGANVIEGLKKGFIETIDKVKSSIIDSVASIADGIKDFLGIHSPSKLMADEVGKFLPQGIAVGFETEIPDTVSDINNSLDDMTRNINIQMPKINNNANNDIDNSDINKSINYENNVPDLSDVALEIIKQPLEIEMLMPDFQNLFSENLTQAVDFETEIPNFNEMINKLDIDSIYSKLDSAVNSQSSIPAYSDVYSSVSARSSQEQQNNDNKSSSETGDIVIPISLFPNSNKFETIIVSAAAKANARSGGISI